MSTPRRTLHDDRTGSRLPRGYTDSSWSTSSVLDTAERAFALLSAAPDPLALPGEDLGHGLPPRPIPVAELRDLLLGPGVTVAAQEAAWQALVRRAQAGDPAWVVACVGMALPGLRHIVWQLTGRVNAQPGDVAAEVVAAFTARLSTIDPDAGMLAARLVWAAHRAGMKLRTAEWELASRTRPLSGSLEPPQPDHGHPDLVLAEAVREEIITEFEASVIAANRLEEIRLADLAAQVGWTYEQLRYARNHAEYRLVYYLTERRLHRIAGKFSHRAQ